MTLVTRCNAGVFLKGLSLRGIKCHALTENLSVRSVLVFVERFVEEDKYNFSLHLE